MYQVEIYGRIRRAVLVEGRSQRSVAREFGLARVTVRKMLGYSIPPVWFIKTKRHRVFDPGGTFLGQQRFS
jgi:ribosomal protein S14